MTTTQFQLLKASALDPIVADLTAAAQAAGAAGASPFQTGAEAARDAAVVARTGAETAETNAETAQAAAEAARDLADADRIAAQAAQAAAEAAQAAAELAGAALTPIDMLHPLYVGTTATALPIPAGWWDTGDRLLSGVATRAIISNWNAETIRGAGPNLFVLADDTARVFGADGVTAVSAPGDAVSLIGDDWEGIELGAELRGTGAVTTSGSPGTLATYNTGTGVGSVFRLDGSNLSGVAVPVTNGAVYLVDVEPTGGAAILQTRQALAGGIYNTSITSRIRQVIVSVSSNILLTTGTNAAGQSFILHSIREILNWPAYQNTAAARPTWGRAPKEVRNLFSATEAFNDEAWSTIGGVTRTADSLTASSTGSFRYIKRTFNVPQNQKHTVEIEAKPGTSDFIWLLGQGSADAFALFNVATGTYVGSFGGGGDPSATEVTAMEDGYFRCRATWTKTTATGSEEIGFGLSDGVDSSVTVGASVFVRKAQAVFGDAVPYQRRGSISTPDITESGVRSFGLLSLDGSDDALLHQLAAGGTVSVAVFGRGGSYLIPSITLAAPSVLQLGPLSVLDDGVLVSGCPTGILRAVGTVPWSSRFQLVGYAIMKANPTAEEKSRAMRYFAAHGARGWLVEGAESVSNPGNPFVSTTGYSAGGSATISVDTGRLKVEQTAGFTDGVLFVLPNGTFSGIRLISFDVDLDSSTLVQVQAGNSSFGNGEVITANITASGTHSIVANAILPGAAGLTFKASSASNFFLSRVSLRALTPEF